MQNVSLPLKFFQFGLPAVLLLGLWTVPPSLAQDASTFETAQEKFNQRIQGLQDSLDTKTRELKLTYLTALGRLKEKYTQAGLLDEVIATRDRINKLSEEELPPLNEDAPTDLQKLDAGFHKALGTEKRKVALQLFQQSQTWVQQLQRQKVDLTKAGNIQEAVKIQEEITRVEELGFKDPTKPDPATVEAAKTEGSPPDSGTPATSVENPLKTARKGLQVYFRFDKNAGVTVPDSGPNKLNGKNQGAVIKPGGVRGGCALFDGNDDSIFVGKPTLYASRGHTAMAWIRPTSFNFKPDYGTILSFAGRHYFCLSKAGNVAAYYYGAYPAGYHLSDTALPLKRWTHAAVTYNGSYVRIYINGKLDKSIYAYGSITPKAGDWGCAMGMIVEGDGDETNRAFHGELDEVMIHNRALSAAEIQAIYKVSRP